MTQPVESMSTRRGVMLLADEPNIRETIAFPLNGNARAC
ncbi:UNVERIFIED_CONTAM: aspartyl-tRNA synthetase [Streptomyces graminofaciens]